MDGSIKLVILSNSLYDSSDQAHFTFSRSLARDIKIIEKLFIKECISICENKYS